jgi:hypothetical protein
LNRRAALFGLLAGTIGTSACGYRIAGKSDLLPDYIQTIAIPTFSNLTNRYKLSERLPAALTREFISRTRYTVTADPDNSDAVLSGAVVNSFSFPNVIDQISYRATAVEVIVQLQLTLVERKTGKILYTRPRMEVRNRYEISLNQDAYFEESDIGLERLSQDVARSVVSSVLEAF